MAYIIAEPCIGTHDTACVDAFPVDCIHPMKDAEYEDGRPLFERSPRRAEAELRTAFLSLSRRIAGFPPVDPP